MARIERYSSLTFASASADPSELRVVHFCSPLFSGCTTLSRQLQAIAGDLPEAVVRVLEINVDLEDYDFLRAFRIEFLPTIAVYAGGKEVERLTELLPHDELDAFLRDTVSYYANPTGSAAPPTPTEPSEKRFE